MRTAIYARISEDRSGEGLGVARQLGDARRLSTSRGWTVVVEHTDNDISALRGGFRPGYVALMTQVDAGELDRIVVWHTSRLWRNRRERAEGIEHLKAARVSVISVKGPELDLTSAAGRMMAGILGEFDTAESEVKSERVKSAALQRAEKGLNHGGRRCFGYTPDGLHLVKDEATEVARMADRLLAGDPLAAIVRDLNARGVTTVTGRPWTSNVVRGVLRNPRMAGLSVNLGKVVGRGQWPIIIAEDQHHAITALLADPSRRTSTGNRAAYLLSGIARCAVCGHSITSHGVKKAVGDGGAVSYRHMYRCRLNGCVGRRRDWVDDWVTSVVLARLSQPDAAALLVDERRPDTDLLRTEAETLRVRLDEAASAFADGAIDSGQLRIVTGKLRDRLDEIAGLQQHTSRAPILRELVTADDIQAVWGALSLDRQRAVVQCLVEVRLKPGGSGRRIFDPQYVEVIPKA